MRDRQPTRRRFLRTGGAVSAAALSGCVLAGDPDDTPVVREDSTLSDRSINSRKRCLLSAGLLGDLGLRVGDQLRVTRADAPDHYANFTVKASVGSLVPRSPTLWLSGGGQRRLEAEAPFPVRVSPRALRPELSPSQAEARTEVTERSSDVRGGRVVVATPHGGDIAPHTGRQVGTCGEALRAAGVRPASYRVLGYGDSVMGAFARWHVTSTDISPRSYPGFGKLLDRPYAFAVSFHGLSDDRLVVGGQAPREVKRTLKRRLARSVDAPVVVADEVRDLRMRGRSPANFVNRIAPGKSIQLEQPLAVRRRHGDAVARVVGEVVAERVGAPG
jgi:phage replication-related protein YjqB (UPF0714/DUF867 family)